MLGQRAIYHQGWLACTVHPPLSGWGKFDQDVRELYNLDQDRAQVNDLAEQEPAQLESLKSLWHYYAGVYNGLPLDDRTALEQVLAERPHAATDRERYVYFPGCADVPEERGVRITGRSYKIAAGVEIDSGDAQGVLYAHGGVAGGHSLYIKDGRLRYAFNWVGTQLQDVVADRDITPGQHLYVAEFSLNGKNEDPAMPASPEPSTSTSTTNRSAALRSSPSPASSASSATASASGATAHHRSPPTTSHHSASAAAPSTRSSSTFPDNPTSTTRHRCEPGSCATSVGRRAPRRSERDERDAVPVVPKGSDQGGPMTYLRSS